MPKRGGGGGQRYNNNAGNGGGNNGGGVAGSRFSALKDYDGKCASLSCCNCSNIDGLLYRLQKWRIISVARIAISAVLALRHHSLTRKAMSNCVCRMCVAGMRMMI